MKYALVCVLAAALGYAAYQFVRMNKLIAVSGELVAKTKPFSIRPQNPDRKILIIGDSLSVGVGASAPEKSIAGLISADDPNASIDNRGVSGSKIADVLKVVNALPATSTYDIAIIQAGANDIVRFTKLSDATRDLQSLLGKAKSISKKVIFLTSGDVGYAPIFEWPLSQIGDYRSKKFFAAFREVAAKEGVTRIDLYYPKSEDPFAKDPGKYYAADDFHVTDAGYALWYLKLKGALQD